MAAKYWIKLWHEILDDPKMGQLPDALWRRSIELFLLAGEYDQDGELPELEVMAWRLRIDTEELETSLTALRTLNITMCLEGVWYIANFSKRQAPATGTERWRQWNERQHKKEYYQTDNQHNSNETLSDKIRIDKNRIDVDETLPKRSKSKPFDKLNTAFINASGIPAFGIKPRDVEAGQRMIDAEVTPDHVTEAVGILLDKKLTMVGLASVEKTAYNVKAQEGYEGKPGQSLEELGYSSG